MIRNCFDSRMFRALSATAGAAVGLATLAAPALFSLLLALPSHAAPGDLDTTFGVGGRVTAGFPGGADFAQAVAVQADGKIVAVGNASNGRDTDFAVLRLNADGSLDAGFANGGKLLLPVGTGEDVATSVALDANERIVIAGHVYEPGGTDPDFAIVRLTSGGALDTTFNGTGKFIDNLGPGSRNFLYAITIDAAGRIVASGGTSFYIGNPGPNPQQIIATVVLRLTENGSPDTSFGIDNGGISLIQDAGDGIAVRVDGLGRIVVAGSNFGVLRLAPNGEPDTTFGLGGLVQLIPATGSDHAKALAIDANNKIVVAGDATDPDSGSSFFAVARLNDNGTPDTGFGTGGLSVFTASAPVPHSDFVSALRIDPSGRIVVAGSTHDYFFTYQTYLVLSRLAPNGMPDTSFGENGHVRDANGIGIFDLAVDGAGRIVVAGMTFTSGSDTWEDFGVQRFLDSGAPDASFGSAGKVVTDLGLSSAEARAMARQSDGKLVVAGWCSPCGTPTTIFGVARFNADGGMDTEFGSGGRLAIPVGPNENRAYAIAIDNSGRIVVGGWSYNSISFSDFAVVRLNANGTLDSTFGGTGKVTIPVGTNEDKAYVLTVDSSNRVLVAGTSITFFGDSLSDRYAIARLNPDGLLDSSFGAGGKVVLDYPPYGFGGWPTGIALDPIGRIVIAGVSGNGSVTIRLLSNGQVDPTFGTGGARVLPGFVANSMILDASGHIVLGGSSVNAATFQDIAVIRLDSAGNVDPGFGVGGTVAIAATPGARADAGYAIGLTRQGNIVVAGYSWPPGNQRFAVARLRPGGEPDARFGAGGVQNFEMGPGDGAAYALTINPDGTLVVAGVAGGVMGVARLLGGETTTRADSNGDGKSDILWRNAGGGDNAIWQMNGTGLATSAFITSVASADWTIAGMGDFDGDGKSDILWRNTATGDNAIWLMNGFTLASGALIPAVPDGNWTIVGVGDFDGDGTSDILWRNTSTGDNAIWLMDGFILTSGALIPGVSAVTPGWTIVGVSDFNGDGRSDILWRNTATGDNAIWLMNGFTLASSALIPGVPAATPGWTIAGVGDYDGNGKADILWRDTGTGDNAIWLMDGFTLTSGALIPSVPDVNWTIVGTGDFDGNGKSDILWRNTGTGDNAIWLMNGTTLDSAALIPAAPAGWSIVNTR